MTRADILSLDDWRAFYELHGAPTFFASPAWSRAVCESNPQYHIYPLKYTLDTAQSVIVPLLRVSGGKLRLRVLVGMPFGAYTAIATQTGPLAQQPAIDEVIRHLRRHTDSVELTLWPLGPQASLFSKESIGYETSVVDLSHGAEAALNSMEGSSRRMAAQAQRKGVVCAVEHGQAAVETYYDILCQAAAKWGLERPTIRKELLLSLVNEGGNDVEIWLARFDGKAIAGGVVLYGLEEAFFWSAATAPDYGVLRANNALAVAIILAAAARNVRWLNLGASQGLPNVLKFKRYLGATEIPYSTIHLQRPVYRFVKFVQSQFSFK